MPFCFNAKKPVVAPTASPDNPIAPNTYAISGSGSFTEGDGSVGLGLGAGGSARATRGKAARSSASPIAFGSLDDSNTASLFEPKPKSVNWARFLVNIR